MTTWAALPPWALSWFWAAWWFWVAFWGAVLLWELQVLQVADWPALEVQLVASMPPGAEPLGTAKPALHRLAVEFPA